MSDTRQQILAAFSAGVYDTRMANSRKAGITRISVTLEEQLLADLQARADQEGVDRLAIIRAALKEHLAKQESPRTGKGKREKK
ncbi:MAG: ribbon-helix-helix domain-containing protein [Luteolibacter sp.]